MEFKQRMGCVYISAFQIKSHRHFFATNCKVERFIFSIYKWELVLLLFYIYIITFKSRLTG